MAGDWIKWGKGLANRREVIILASKLGRDRHEIAGRLMVLWEWCDENIPDSEVDSVSLNASLFLGDKPYNFLDSLLGLPGFAEALASPEVRWLTARSEGRLVFPNFGRHNGTTSKTRAYEARKKQKQRKGIPNLSPKMSLSHRDKTGTREEKRREDIKTEDKEPPNPLPGGAAGDGKRKAATFDPLKAEIPPPLDTPSFREAWALFCRHRSELPKAKAKPLTPTAVATLLKRLAASGAAAAIRDIEHSVGNGWAGIYEPDSETKGSSNGKRPNAPAPASVEYDPSADIQF